MRRAKRIIMGLLCAGMLIGNAGSVYAQEDVSQEQVAEEQNVSIINDDSSKDASMDGQRRLDEIYRVDENGNTSLIEDSSSDTALPAEDEEDSADRARSTSVKIVNFRANKKGEAVSSSQVTEYTEYKTGASGYICGAVGADGAYLGTSNGKVRFMIAGVIGEVDESKVQVTDLDNAQSYSSYYADSTTLVHHICMNMTTPGWGASVMVGMRPDYLTAGTTYYSYDGHYFYTSYSKMLLDYQSDTRSHAVNAGNPYYNYYQYLPLRTVTEYSGSELDSCINTYAGSSSKMYNTGSTFVNYQNTYGTNALLMASVAACESGWGKSYYALNRNNLFGLNAVDSDTGQAFTFNSVDGCIKDFSETYLSKRYLRPGYTYYHGAFLGDKSSGINVSYASNPYWGEEIANVAWNLDKAGGYKDKEKYTIGIKDTDNITHNNVNVRKEASTSTAVLYTTGSHSNYSVLIRGEKDGFYEIQSDAVLNSGRSAVDTSSGKYSVDNMYSYISKDYVKIISQGSWKPGDNSGDNSGGNSGGSGGDSGTDIVTPEEGIDYSVHCQTYGWMDTVSDGETAGTSDESKRLEALKISLRSPSVEGGVKYRVHCQTYGWMDWKENGAEAGTSGESKRLEAVQIQLTGQMADKYDIYYRVHSQSYGWLDWAVNGECAGTSGYGKRLEAIQIKLVPKGGTIPGSTENPYVQSLVKYKTHVQTYGWQSWAFDGETAGTSGESKRLEALQIKLVNPEAEGAIEYRAHVQSYGWQDWVSNGKSAGTSGKAKRLEAVQIRLTGAMAEKYDVYYRVHSQSYGWLGWAKNEEPAGTSGLAKRMEAVEIKLVPKGNDVPGSTEGSYITQ